jgi:hypothetical protein
VLVRLRGWYSVAPPSGGADWAQEGNGPTHLRTNPAETVLSPTTVTGLGQAWSAPVGETRAGPVVVDGVVYAGSVDGRVHALDAATGASIWSVATTGEIRGSPAVAGGLVYVGCGSGALRALDAGPPAGAPPSEAPSRARRRSPTAWSTWAP